MEDPKQEITHVELNNIPPKNGLCAEEIELQTALRSYVPNTDAENKLRRNIDLHLMPILWIMYILNYIDRTNIVSAFADLETIELTFHREMPKLLAWLKTSILTANVSRFIWACGTVLSKIGYAWVISIFFGYLLCEVPSNMILSRTHPSIFLPAIMIV